MTAQPPDPTPREDAPGLGRRRFLARVGIGGLAVAGATFGRASSASAAGGCGCCNLAHCPSNIGYQNCMSNAVYSWRCYYSRNGIPYQCECCETSGYRYSAYACWPR
jgi:hypothetical protein